MPNASSPRSARARAPATLSRIHAILVPEKYGSSSSPVRSRTRRSAPSLRSLAHAGAVRRSCQTMARWIGSPVRPVPHDCRFALVGDPDRGDTPRARPAPVDGFAHRRQRAAPDVLGVVLDPSRSRIVLREFAPRQRHGLTALIEYEAARRGRALVNGENVSGMAHRSGGAYVRPQPQSCAFLNPSNISGCARPSASSRCCRSRCSSTTPIAAASRSPRRCSSELGLSASEIGWVLGRLLLGVRSAAAGHGLVRGPLRSGARAGRRLPAVEPRDRFDGLRRRARGAGRTAAAMGAGEATFYPSALSLLSRNVAPRSARARRRRCSSAR